MTGRITIERDGRGLVDRCIQVADLVAGAIIHKYGSGEYHYYDKIKSKISVSMGFFEGNDEICVVNPSLLRPIRLRAASSFLGRTYNTTPDNMHRALYLKLTKMA
jgi:hypothetical protein